jgi:hypothetical protein
VFLATSLAKARTLTAELLECTGFVEEAGALSVVCASADRRRQDGLTISLSLSRFYSFLFIAKRSRLCWVDADVETRLTGMRFSRSGILREMESRRLGW